MAKGACIVVQKGRCRKNMAILVPFARGQGGTRRLGLLAKRGKPVFKGWEMTEDEFFASR